MSSPTHGPPATPVRTRNSAGLTSQTPTPTTLTASTRKRHCELIASALGEHVNGRKKQKKVDDLQPYRHAARWIPRSIDPFLDIRLVFRTGAHAAVEAAIAAARDAGDNEDVAELEAIDKDPAVEAMEPDYRARYVAAYNSILALVPGFRDTLDELSDGTQLENFVGMIDHLHRQARSDDTGSLSDRRVYYIIDADPNPLPDAPITSVGHELLHKKQLGFNNMLTAQRLCPIRVYKEFMLDPVGVAAKLQVPLSDQGEDLTYSVTAKKWPAFMFADPTKWVPGQLDRNFCHSLLPVRLLRHVYTSPSSAIDPAQKANKGRACQAKLHGMTSVSPRHITYAMCHTRHLLSEKDEWSVKDGDFDLEDFFLRIVAVFESAPDSDWVKSTLEWWNLQVFRYRQPLVARTVIHRVENDDDDDLAVLMATRRAQTQAAGIENMPAGNGSSATPSGAPTSHVA